MGFPLTKPAKLRAKLGGAMSPWLSALRQLGSVEKAQLPSQLSPSVGPGCHAHDTSMNALGLKVVPCLEERMDGCSSTIGLLSLSLSVSVLPYPSPLLFPPLLIAVLPHQIGAARPPAGRPLLNIGQQNFTRGWDGQRQTAK